MKNRKPNRMAGFDYSRDALYFLTSCVQDRICVFGEITNGTMICNEYGIIAQIQWSWLTTQYPYTKSHAFVVMPNHIHGVLEINRDFDHPKIPAMIDFVDVVGEGRDLPLQHQQNQQQQPPVTKIKSISELMGAYKTTVSKKIHLLGNAEFQWQRSFHDHIIRDLEVYEKIVCYIRTNPQLWEEDKFKD